VNAETTSPDKLACLPAATAGGDLAETAAAGLICARGHFLHQPAFRRLTATETSMFTGEPVTMIRWKAVTTAPDAGRLCCPPSEQAIARIAASIADPDIGVQLGGVPGTLDRRNITLVAGAITAANG
jgi:hypothetical protein